MIEVYMTDKVTIRTKNFGAYGVTSYVDTSNVAACIVYETKILRNDSGEQILSAAKIYMKDRILSAKDKINFDGSDHAILSIRKKRDFSQIILIVYVDGGGKHE